MFFHFHTDDDIDNDFNAKLRSMRCVAVKKDGVRCKRNTVIGQEYCYSHRESILNLRIQDSTIANAGKGLFAVGYPDKIIFKKDARICKYNGEVIDEEELDDRYGEFTAPYGIKLYNDLYEDAGVFRGIGAMANHSGNQRKINAKLSVGRDNRAQLKAIKNIKGGQEIVVNYGNRYNFNEDVCTSTNRLKYTC